MFTDLFENAIKYIDDKVLPGKKDSDEQIDSVLLVNKRKDFVKKLGEDKFKFDGPVTHLPKFTHSSSKAIGINCTLCTPKWQSHNNLLSSYTSGDLKFDVYSNAANSKGIGLLLVEDRNSNSFMTLLALGKESILNDFLRSERIGCSEDEAKDILSNLVSQFTDDNSAKLANLELLKQVYFPYARKNEQTVYKNLVLYYASSLHMSLTEKIAQKVKEIREGNEPEKDKQNKNEGKQSIGSFCKHFGTIKMGGSKPQNVSFLNNKLAHGNLSLLSCSPMNEYIPRTSQMIFSMGALHYQLDNFVFHWGQLNKLKGWLEYAYQRPVLEVFESINDIICEFVSSLFEFISILNFSRKFWQIDEEYIVKFKSIYDYLQKRKYTETTHNLVLDFLCNYLISNLENKDKPLDDVKKEYLCRSIESFLRTFEEEWNE